MPYIFNNQYLLQLLQYKYYYNLSFCFKILKLIKLVHTHTHTNM